MEVEAVGRVMRGSLPRLRKNHKGESERISIFLSCLRLLWFPLMDWRGTHALFSREVANWDDTREGALAVQLLMGSRS